MDCKIKFENEIEIRRKIRQVRRENLPIVGENVNFRSEKRFVMRILDSLFSLLRSVTGRINVHESLDYNTDDFSTKKKS
jgi:hypothetical protein